MAVQYANGKRTSSAGFKVLLTGVIGLAAAIFSGLTVSWSLAPIIGWEVSSTIFLAWTWLGIMRVDETLTAEFSKREDPSRGATDVTVLVASIASLLALVLVLAKAGNSSGSAKLWQVALGVLSVVLSWLIVHTIYMLKYAELYYQTPVGGVDFNGTTKPTYTDFAYLAFTIGMTFQVSDTGLKQSAFRRTALKHSLLSYIFGTIIIATTINLIAGLSK